MSQKRGSYVHHANTECHSEPNSHLRKGFSDYPSSQFSYIRSQELRHYEQQIAQAQTNKRDYERQIIGNKNTLRKYLRRLQQSQEQRKAQVQKNKRQIKNLIHEISDCQQELKRHPEQKYYQEEIELCDERIKKLRKQNFQMSKCLMKLQEENKEQKVKAQAKTYQTIRVLQKKIFECQQRITKLILTKGNLQDTGSKKEEKGKEEKEKLKLPQISTQKSGVQSQNAQKSEKKDLSPRTREDNFRQLKKQKRKMQSQCAKSA